MIVGVVTDLQNSQEITHEKNLVGCKDLTENFLRTMEPLGDRLGPLLLQLPPSFTVEGMGVLERERDDDLRWWSGVVDRFLE